MVLTNNLTVYFNHEKIANDFIICTVNRDKTFKGRKNRDQFKYDPRLFDVPLAFFHVRSIVYLYGGTFYVMFDKTSKAKKQKRHFRQAIESLDRDAMISFTESASDIRKLLASQNGKRALTQLFFNALDTRSKLNSDCQNIGGHLYYQKIPAKRKNQLVFIEAKIINGDTPDTLLLTLPIVTFTKLNARLLKDNPRAILYTIDENGNFNRELNNTKFISGINDITSNIYIQKTDNSHKNTTNLLAIRNASTFNRSKLGIASHLITDINDSFNDYLSVLLTPKDFKKSPVFEQENRFMVSDSNLSEIFNHDGLNIVDLVCDTVSDAFLYGEFSNESSANILEILAALNIRPENVKIVRKTGNKSLDEPLLLSKSQFNICLVHDDQDDVNHHDYQNAPVQHIGIYHTDNSKKPKPDKPKKDLLTINKKGVPTIFKKVLYELLIKKDIVHKQLLNVDWTSFSKGKKWTFAVPELTHGRNSKEKITSFEQMILYPDGHFDFDRFDQNDFSDEGDTKQKTIDFYDTLTSYGPYRRSQIEMIFYTDSSNMQAVIRTEAFPMPNISHLSEDFKNPYFPQRMWQLLDDFKNTLSDQTAEKAMTNAIVALKKDGPQLSTKTAYSTIKTYIPLKILHALEDYLLQRGMMLKPGSKDKRFEDRYHIEDMVSCHYNQPDEKTFYYYIGLSKRTDLNLSFAKSDLIRKVVAEQQVNPDTYLALLKTNMVRTHKFSVLPFPAKYIREARNMTFGHVLNE